MLQVKLPFFRAATRMITAGRLGESSPSTFVAFPTSGSTRAGYNHWARSQRHQRHLMQSEILKLATSSIFNR